MKPKKSNMNSNQEIFAVIVFGKSAPMCFHDNYLDAENEAVRLCKKERIRTYVLKVVSTVELQEVIITRHDDTPLDERPC